MNRPATRYFTEVSQAATNSVVVRGSNRGRFEVEANAMRYMKDKVRVSYARVLYAAAVAVLLSACTQIDSTPAARASTEPTVDVSENADMPVVIVTASRNGPEKIG